MNTPKHTTAPKGAEVPPGLNRVPNSRYSNYPSHVQLNLASSAYVAEVTDG